MRRKKHNAGAEWKRAGPLTSDNLAPRLSTFSSPPFFLSLCRISPNPPITVMSGWERGRERLCVTGRLDGGEGGRDGERRFITAVYLVEVSLILWPHTDWSVKINSRDQMSGPGVLCCHTNFVRAHVWASGFKLKCHSKSALAQSTLL